jgi:hypothetical protein
MREGSLYSQEESGMGESRKASAGGDMGFCCWDTDGDLKDGVDWVATLTMKRQELWGLLRTDILRRPFRG